MTDRGAGHVHSRGRRPVHPGGSGCTAELPRRTEFDMPVVCGWLASHPHPDPDVTYLQPLCCEHFIEAEAELEATS